MANFRRTKPAHRTNGGRLTKYRVKKMEKAGVRYLWAGNWPAWWDLIFHRRPPRRHQAALAKLVLRDLVDADEANWPLAKKPHNYFW